MKGSSQLFFGRKLPPCSLGALAVFSEGALGPKDMQKFSSTGGASALKRGHVSLWANCHKCTLSAFVLKYDQSLRKTTDLYN